MHSSPAEVNIGSVPPPDQPGPQPVNVSRRRWLKANYLKLLVAASAIVIVAWLLLKVRSKAGSSDEAAQASFRTDSFQTIRLRGTTEAVQSRAILTPLRAEQQLSTLTIVRLTAAGTEVNPGEVLVEFDRQAQQQNLIDKQADYRKLVDQVTEEQAKEAAARAKDETELKQAEDNLRRAELEVQRSEIASRIDAEKNQENLDEAKATLAQLQETFDLKRKAAQAGIRILEIQRDRAQQTMMHAQADAALMQIRSPIAGVVVLNSIWKQGTMGEVQEGDKVQAGVPFMQVVNPSAMQVRVLANQQDFPSLRVGQRAKVRLDAYPELVFPGRVEQLAPIAVRGTFSSKLRVFAVIVTIFGSDPKLMPDLSAAVDVDLVGENVVPTTGSGS